MIPLARTAEGRVRATPSVGMLGRAKEREEEGKRNGQRHFESEQYFCGFLAEACYHIALGRAGVEHRWLDDWSLVDIELHNGRRVDVKCRQADGGWREEYGISVPAYIVERRSCDLVALAAWDGREMLLLGMLTVEGVERNGTFLRTGERYSSGKPVRHPCYEIIGARIPRLAGQLGALKRGSYAQEKQPDWWMRLWPDSGTNPTHPGGQTHAKA